MSVAVGTMAAYSNHALGLRLIRAAARSLRRGVGDEGFNTGGARSKTAGDGHHKWIVEHELYGFDYIN